MNGEQEEASYDFVFSDKIWFGFESDFNSTHSKWEEENLRKIEWKEIYFAYSFN